VSIKDPDMEIKESDIPFAPQPPIEFIRDFEVLGLKKGDIIAVRPKKPMTADRMVRFAGSCRAMAQDTGVKIILLPYDLEMGVVRKEDADGGK